MRRSGVTMWLGLGSALLFVSSAASQEAPDRAAPEASLQRAMPGSTSGTVAETMNTAGYTYVLIEAGEKRLWFAAPEFAVAVGNKVVAPTGAPMRNHYSKTLDRTFDLIYFVGGIRVEGSLAKSSKSPFTHSGAGPVEEFDLSGIARVEGGKTVAEIFDEGSQLAGQLVAVRGRVTKFSPRILETNFLHLQDGTSSRDGRNDLTVTTKTDVEVGSLVVVRGRLSADKDFGFGYTYDLIVEDANVTEQ